MFKTCRFLSFMKCLTIFLKNIIRGKINSSSKPMSSAAAFPPVFMEWKPNETKRNELGGLGETLPHRGHLCKA